MKVGTGGEENATAVVATVRIEVVIGAVLRGKVSEVAVVTGEGVVVPSVIAGGTAVAALTAGVTEEIVAETTLVVTIVGSLAVMIAIGAVERGVMEVTEEDKGLNGKDDLPRGGLTCRGRRTIQLCGVRASRR